MWFDFYKDSGQKHFKGHISISSETPWIDQGQKCVRLVLRNVFHEGIPHSQCIKMVIYIWLRAGFAGLTRQAG